MKRMGSFAAVLPALAAFVLVTSLATANVLVYNVHIDNAGPAPFIKYRLLDQASSVKIEIFGPLPATTVLGEFDGTTFQGQNSVMWTGFLDGTVTTEGETYGFRIKATGVPHADYTLLNDTNIRAFQFEQPRGGVAVNNNMNSDYFGYVYVGNTRVGTTATGRDTGNGFYIVYPDGTDILGQGDTPITGGIDWSLSNFSSPYHCQVGPDDKVYIPDWSDPHSGLWRAAPDLSGTFEEILGTTSRDSAGLCGVLHGSIAGIFLLPNGNDLDIYWQDEDLTVATGSDPSDGLRNIWKYTLTPSTTLPVPDSTPATLVVDENNFSTFTLFNVGGSTLGLFVNDLGGGLAIDKYGRIFVSNYRAIQDWPCLMVFSPDAQHLWWDSKELGSASGDDPLTGSRSGMVIDNVLNVCYMVITNATNTGGLAVIPTSPLPTGDLATAMTFVDNPDFTGESSGGINLDAARNVYYASNLGEALYIYSPPGANNFTFERASLTLPGGALFVKAQGSWTLYE